VGGGINFQAAVTAIVGVHILSGTALNWLEGVCRDKPVAVWAESEGPGNPQSSISAPSILNTDILCLTSPPVPFYLGTRRRSAAGVRYGTRTIFPALRRLESARWAFAAS
jgi:hypothetical protein